MVSQAWTTAYAVVRWSSELPSFLTDRGRNHVLHAAFTQPGVHLLAEPLQFLQVAAIVQTLNEIDDDDDEEEDKERIDLPPDKLVWIGCAVSGLMAVFTAALALCTVNEATKSRSLCLSVGPLNPSDNRIFDIT